MLHNQTNLAGCVFPKFRLFGKKGQMCDHPICSGIYLLRPSSFHFFLHKSDHGPDNLSFFWVTVLLIGTLCRYTFFQMVQDGNLTDIGMHKC